jgi:hypothetical protein
MSHASKKCKAFKWQNRDARIYRLNSVAKELIAKPWKPSLDCNRTLLIRTQRKN